MTEDLEIIRMNIRHYEDLLKLHGVSHRHEQVLKLLAEARQQLVIAEAEARGVEPL